MKMILTNLDVSSTLITRHILPLSLFNTRNVNAKVSMTPNASAALL